MNDDLKNRIHDLRQILNSLPDGPVYGSIPPGIPNPNSGSEFWNCFLKTCDGGRYGSVDLFANKNLAMNQFHLESTPEAGTIVVGQILYQPLFLDESNHLIWRQDAGNLIDMGYADDVILQYFLGSR